MTSQTEIMRRLAADRSRAYMPVPVYFIQYGFDGLIKIGYSTNVRKRMADIQPFCPLALQLLGWVPGGVRGEADMHDRFRESRAWGEWFAPTTDLTEFCRTEIRHDEPPVFIARRLGATGPLKLVSGSN